MKNIVLDIKDLAFCYEKNKFILKDFSLELKKGEIKTIFGKSGSGKTTLFELIIGSIKPQKGSIKKDDFSVIFQDPYNSFHPSYTVYEQIKDVITYDFDENLDKTIKKLSLNRDILYKKPHQLSGGQLQRCSILRAILSKPKLLLVDEPTSALDNIIALDVMKLLVSFLDECGILLITHDLHLAKWCSDEIIRIDS